MNEKTRKETIIDRLLELQAITPMEAVELLKDDYKFPQVPVLPIIPQQPYLPYPQPVFPIPQQDWRQKWANEELERRARVVDNCPCNPKNGGSGVCGCTMGGGSVIMC